MNGDFLGQIEKYQRRYTLMRLLFVQHLELFWLHLCSNIWSHCLRLISLSEQSKNLLPILSFEGGTGLVCKVERDSNLKSFANLTWPRVTEVQTKCVVLVVLWSAILMSQTEKSQASLNGLSLTSGLFVY